MFQSSLFFVKHFHGCTTEVPEDDKRHQQDSCKSKVSLSTQSQMIEFDHLKGLKNTQEKVPNYLLSIESVDIIDLKKAFDLFISSFSSVFRFPILFLCRSCSSVNSLSSCVMFFFLTYYSSSYCSSNKQDPHCLSDVLL